MAQINSPQRTTIHAHENGVDVEKILAGGAYGALFASLVEDDGRVYVAKDIHLYPYQLAVRDIQKAGFTIVGFWHEGQDNREPPSYVAYCGWWEAECDAIKFFMDDVEEAMANRVYGLVLR